MQDTTREAQAKQLEIILSKTARERAIMGIDMMESVYRVVKNSIKNENPHLNDREVITELFLRYYGNEFSEKEKVRIIDWLKSKS